MKAGLRATLVAIFLHCIASAGQADSLECQDLTLLKKYQFPRGFTRVPGIVVPIVCSDGYGQNTTTPVSNITCSRHDGTWSTLPTCIPVSAEWRVSVGVKAGLGIGVGLAVAVVVILIGLLLRPSGGRNELAIKQRSIRESSRSAILVPKNSKTSLHTVHSSPNPLNELSFEEEDVEENECLDAPVQASVQAGQLPQRSPWATPPRFTYRKLSEEDSSSPERRSSDESCKSSSDSSPPKQAPQKSVPARERSSLPRSDVAGTRRGSPGISPPSPSVSPGSPVMSHHAIPVEDTQYDSTATPLYSGSD